MLRFAALLNHFYSGGLPGLSGAVAFFGVVSGTIWGVASALGIPPGLQAVSVVGVVAALCTAAVALLKPVRWALIASTLRHGIQPVVLFRPDLLIGIGPGGAIIAGMLAKQLAERRGVEPLVYVLDRKYEWEGRTLHVTMSEVSTSGVGLVPEVGRVLLVTSEVHTGNTLRRASDYLVEVGIKHKIFSLITSPTTGIRVDHTLIVSDQRGLLPWRDLPQRETEQLA